MLRLMSIMLVLICFSSFQLVASGCIKGDCRNGYGTYLFPSGARYIGNFVDGKAHGKGIIYFNNGNKYIGHWAENQREGTGRLVYKEGHEYFGGFKFNKRNGKGVMSYANGDRYEGNWKNDQPNGYGQYLFKDGDRYEGTFEKGRFEGKGTMFYADGAKFVGWWQQNKKHGIGILHLNDGRQISGQWDAGRFLNKEENLALFAPNVESGILSREETHRSSLRNCNQVYCQSGEGFYIYTDGTKYEGNFQEGFPSGYGTTYYANGDKYIGQWRNHAPHGKGVMYFKSGRILSARWQNGEVNANTVIADQPATNDVPTPEKTNEVKIWAVVVGIGSYNDMPSLRYTDDDAYQIYAFLKSPEGGALGDDQVRLLIDENATRKNIMRDIQATFMKADENDVVLFYFSGHGLDGSFIPVDFDGYNNRLYHDEIKLLLEQSKAKHKLVIGDACHSGSLLAMKMPINTTLKKYYQAFDNTDGGLALMMSSKREEVSLEDSGLRSGVFSYYLIRGLKGGADSDQNTIVTISELYDFVYKNVRKYTANAQTPTLSGSYDKRMPVSVVDTGLRR